jgi:hypothetical protein
LTAIGILFKEAGAESFEWMTASDAAFSLTGNLVTTASVIWTPEVFHDATALKFLPLLAVLVYI